MIYSHHDDDEEWIWSAMGFGVHRSCSVRGAVFGVERNKADSQNKSKFPTEILTLDWEWACSSQKTRMRVLP